jgi:Na+/melibiose symporter-like transporter
VAKLKNGLIGSVVLFSLSAVGFVEGENAIQPAGVDDGVWALFCLFPAVGFAIALVILLVFYKLRTKEVQVMSLYNNGQISKEEAEAAAIKRIKTEKVVAVAGAMTIAAAAAYVVHSKVKP